LEEYLSLFTIYLRFTSNMADSVYASYPPDLSSAQQKFLVTAVKDWAIQNGLAVRPSPAIVPPGTDSNGVLATNAPVTLFPSPFPRACFQEATALQSIYNELYAAITCDTKWLGNIVEGLVFFRLRDSRY
jgi:glutathione synthase